jgi:hypothetical protein
MASRNDVIAETMSLDPSSGVTLREAILPPDIMIMELFLWLIIIILVVGTGG